MKLYTIIIYVPFMFLYIYTVPVPYTFLGQDDIEMMCFCCMVLNVAHCGETARGQFAEKNLAQMIPASVY